MKINHNGKTYHIVKKSNLHFVYKDRAPMYYENDTHLHIFVSTSIDKCIKFIKHIGEDEHSRCDEKAYRKKNKFYLLMDDAA